MSALGQKRTLRGWLRMSALGHNVHRPVQQCCAPRWSQLSQLSQQLIGRHVERVLAQNTANNRKGVGAQNLHKHVGAKSGAVIDADNDVVVFRTDVAEAAFVLYNVLDSGKVFEGPFLVGPESRQPIGTASALCRCIEV